MEKLKKKLKDKTLSAEALQMIFDKVSEMQTEDFFKNSIFADIIMHPNCTDELAQKSFLKIEYDYEDLPKIAGVVMYKNPTQEMIGYIKEKIRNRYISKLLYGDDSELKVASFIKIVHQAIKSGDENKIKKIKDIILKKGKAAIYVLDHKAVEWFINHGTPENLEALNSLRGLYGLRTEVRPFSHDDADIVDIKRMQFSGYAEPVSAKLDDPETHEEEDNPHYKRKHSAEFLTEDRMSDDEMKKRIMAIRSSIVKKNREIAQNTYGIEIDESDTLYITFAAVFEEMVKLAEKRGDKKQAKKLNKLIEESKIGFSREYRSVRPDYSLSDLENLYDLSENEAHKKMKAAGVAFPEDELIKAFAQHRYRPEDVKKFNVTDLMHIYVEYVGLGKISLQDYHEAVEMSVRERFWREVAKNEELKLFISKDLENKGIDKEDIARIWRNCEEYGSPCFIYPRCEDNVYGVSLQVHHMEALKDGGKNEMDNLVIVVNMREATQILSYDGDILDRDGGNYSINSHMPLHEYDNPLIYIYQGKDGKLFLSDKERDDLPRMKILTYLTASCGKGEHVLYYGGPDAKSCCVGRLDGHVHGVEYNVIKKNSAGKTGGYVIKKKGR